MEKMGLNKIREEYLSFFESKGHLRLPSFSLIPKNDNSLLLINAGMAPLKPYFTGLQEPPRRRVTTCQKCIRTGDIENVGKTSRHGTFFEMLGNFSFGDYFKNEVIPWAWEFTTEVLKFPKDKLYVTIYLEDDEAYDIWTKKTDVDPSHIFRLDKEENFWEHGSGPCGPCSEIHFNKKDAKINNAEEFMKASDADEAVEFWNLVFTQFDRDEDGNYNKLKNPNIDTGMGLERIATIMQEKNSIFEIDTIGSILHEVCKISGAKYGEDPKIDISLRIITDHVRSISFMVSDGIIPSNEGRGYVLRRLLRRAARHGKSLGIKDAFLCNICDVVIRDSGDAYPELKEKAEYIKKVIKLEEERFRETIDSGMDILKSYVEELEQHNKKVLSGERAFKLYDTYGFPIELTEEILEEMSIKIDKDGFNSAMKEQRERARAARQESNYMGTDVKVLDRISNDVVTTFDGYDKVELNSKVKVIISEDEFSQSIGKGMKGIILTEVTPFYAEMGGQVGDTGIIYNDKFKAKVLDCKKNIGNKIIHIVNVIEGTLNIDDEVNLKVDAKRRSDICKNHTTTHMVDQALKMVLGDHVHQAGSYVNEQRIRFDFTHFGPLTQEEIQKTEDLVNEKIMNVYDVKTEVMSLEKAKKSGAIALFNDKYDEKVRVVKVGDFSSELCGGTHIDNAGKIGLFKIISENGIAAGTRRIEAVTGINAIKYIEDKNTLLKSIEKSLKCSENEILNRLEMQNAEIKEKDKEIMQLKAKSANSKLDDILNNVIETKGINIAVGALKDIDSNSLRDLADKIKNKIGDGVVVLASENKGKVQLVAMATKKVVLKGIHCGKIIKEVSTIVGGGGGGRPDMAQAGGKNPEKVDEALAKVKNVVENLVK